MAELRELTIMIDSDLDDELTELAATTGRDKVTIAREALTEWLEDQEDVQDAETVIAANNPAVSLEEVRRTLGMEG